MEEKQCYRIIARVKNGNTIYGYILEYNSSERPRGLFTKQQTYSIAEKNKIYNIKHAIINGKPTIMGINGFKLRNLPYVDLESALEAEHQQRNGTIGNFDEFTTFLPIRSEQLRERFKHINDIVKSGEDYHSDLANVIKQSINISDEDIKQYRQASDKELYNRLKKGIHKNNK